MHISENDRFHEFRRQLEAQGVELRLLVEGDMNWNNKASKYDVHLYQVRGTERPYAGTIMVLNYGKDGYGVWIEAESADIAEDVQHIAKGPRAARAIERIEHVLNIGCGDPQRDEALGPAKVKDIAAIIADYRGKQPEPSFAANMG